MKIFTKIRCALFGHRWTSAAEQGLKPTKEQIDNGFEGFKDYAKMYCRKCGYVSPLNDTL